MTSAKIQIFSLVAISWSMILQASPGFLQKNQEAAAFQKLLRLELSGAEKILKGNTSFESQVPQDIYLIHYTEFLRVFITGNPELWERYKISSSTRRKQLASCIPNEYLYYSLWNLHLQDAILRVRFGEQGRALLSLFYFQRALQDGLNAYPGFVMNMQGLAFYEILSGLVPSDYSWVLRLAGIRGDLDSGLRTFEIYAGQVRDIAGFGEEAQLLRWIMMIQFRNEPFKVLTEIEGRNDFPDMDVARAFVYSLAAMKSGQSQRALPILARYQPVEGEQEVCFMYLLRGEALLYREDGNAGYFLRKFLERYEGHDYRKVAWQKLAMHEYLQGNLVRMQESLTGLRSDGSLLTDPDRQAYTELNRLKDYNPVLLRSRLRFDGGYYQEALQILQDFSPLNEFERMEHHYRLARIFHKTMQTDKAIELYKLVLRGDTGGDHYLPAYSALQLGHLFRERHDRTRAAEFYQLALTLTRGEFKRTIDWEAGRFLKQVKDQR